MPGPAAIYQAIRTLAPKSRNNNRIQLRSKDGSLQSPAEEIRSVKEHFQELYARSSQNTQCTEVTSTFTQVAIQEEEVLGAMTKLKALKALPPTYAPTVLWKLATQEVVPYLHRTLQHSLQNMGELHKDWHRVHVCLLPKVPFVKMPKQLRPICLLAPGSKVLATILADRLRAPVATYLSQVPQFAYIPQRSTADAIERVCSHLHAARILASEADPTLHARRKGMAPASVGGGISLSLDVNKAFDALPRAQLIAAMKDAQLDPTLISLINHIHQQAVLVLNLGKQQAEVALEQGIRQGCGLSPLLWALTTGYLCNQYQAACRQQHLSGGEVTLYADDFYTTWLVRNPPQLAQAVRSMGLLIQVMEAAGFTLSAEKTVIMYALQGSSATSLLAKRVQKDEQGAKFKIRVGREHRLYPVVTSIMYLGAKLPTMDLRPLTSSTAWGSPGDASGDYTAFSAVVASAARPKCGCGERVSSTPSGTPLHPQGCRGKVARQ